MNGPEWLCLWYLRLNGYFTLPNFIAHARNGPLTDVDVLAVRFPHSKEATFNDDQRLQIPADDIDIVFAEAKRGQIDHLNGPWSSPEKGTFDYVLKRVGIVPQNEVKRLAEEVYERKEARRNGIGIRIVCFAESIGATHQLQDVTFIPWSEVLGFIQKRFRENQRVKAEHEAWDEFGHYLWNKLEAGVPDVGSFFAGWEQLGARRGRNGH